MLERTLCMLLAGGVGSRLYPLTTERAKPGVPFGASYRIIDFTLSNCLHSGLRRVLVLTQYKSHSLQKHMRDGWSVFNPSLGEYITPVPPQMRTGDSWYAGTADAIYQNLYLIDRSEADFVVILSGDHIYRMDYAAMLETHRTRQADLTIACMEVPIEDAREFGVMGVDDDARIVQFQEKPESPHPIPDHPDRALASMGIYVFSTELLTDTLRVDHENENSSHDFGKDIIPKLIETHRVCAYRFSGEGGRVSADGYWRDVGTVDAYFDANMDLLKTPPPLDLYQKDWAIRSYLPPAPPARVVQSDSGRQSEVRNSILGNGAIVSGGTVQRSLLSSGVTVEENAAVSDAIILDDVRVGRGAQLKRCIVDKYVDIPEGETIGCDETRDRERFTVSPGGVVVVPRNYQFG